MFERNGLNEAQYRAVTYGTEDPLLVLAGPGSGKTYTLTARILYLIEEAHISPEKILVLTFTKTAALDMQRRFQEKAKEKGCFYSVNFGTFHSAFYYILCQSHILKPAQLWSESRKRNLLIPLLKEYLSQKEELFTGSFYNEAAELLSAFSFYKNTYDKEKTLLKLSPFWREDFDSIFALYERRRRDCGGFDFDDMLSECLNLFRQDKKSLQYWQERFPYLLLDEFQDINPVQYQIIKLLGAKGRIFAVGDDDQSIYGFRGSQPACLKQFAEDFKARKILLDINYRSCPDIVKTSLLVIGENKERFPKKLKSYQEISCSEETESRQEIRSFVTLHYFPEKQEQLAYLAGQLKKIPEQETYAVLFRTNIQMQRAAAFLKRVGIPCRMREKSVNLYEHFIVKDIMAYLFLGTMESKSGRKESLWDASDLFPGGKTDALLQIINKPVRYVSREAVVGHGNVKDLTAYYQREYSRGGKRRIGEELIKLQRHLEKIGNMQPFLAVQYIRKGVGYEKYLQNMAGGGRSEGAKWQEILEWLSEEASHFESVEQWIAFWKEGGGSKPVLEEAPSGQAVELMTVHASKGLEFDRVWIPDCNERVFPYGQMPDERTVEEERRIFYVAMTRAKKSLELLCTCGAGADTGNSGQPSRFLMPIPQTFHQTHSCREIHQRHRTRFQIPHRFQ